MQTTLPSTRFWRHLTGGLLVLAAPLLLASCDDNSTDIETIRAQALKRQKEVRAADSLAINKYIADSSFVAQRQPSGLYIIYKNAGTGALPIKGQTATVFYRGTFLDSRAPFDRGLDKDGKPAPFSFGVGQGNVIFGFDQGVSLTRLGQKAILLIPSELAYGPNGGSTIPPDSPLRFDIELTKLQ